jgi:hypothetical protein
MLRILPTTAGTIIGNYMTSRGRRFGNESRQSIWTCACTHVRVRVPITRLTLRRGLSRVRNECCVDVQISLDFRTCTSGLETVLFGWNHAPFRFLGNSCEEEFNHSQKVVTSKAIFIKDLEHQFMFIWENTKDKFFVP